MSQSTTQIPNQLCNIDRLVHAMEARDLDGIVVSSANNVFYLSGFNGVAHKSDEPRPYAFVLSRHAPDRPILIVADYYLGSALRMPTWVEEIRSFRAVMLPLDIKPQAGDLSRFIPSNSHHDPRIQTICDRYQSSLSSACVDALRELNLDHKRVGFDELRFGFQLGLASSDVTDAYDALMFARAVKTDAEHELLKRATTLNEQAITNAIKTWSAGMSWREFNHSYHMAALELGGFVRDPSALVWGHPQGTDPAITLYLKGDDFILERGMHIMFDCHGTLDMYCWDGGKTWIVDGEPEGIGATNASAADAVAAEVMQAMRPGVTVSQLQALGRRVFKQNGVADPNAALIFFHGLGLSHMDIEQTLADGTPNVDWALQAGMVVPLHILYPGGEAERVWVEEVVEVTPSGGQPYFSWGFEPLCGQG